MLEVWADQQKILHYWTKYTILRIIYSLSILFLGCIKTTCVDAQQLVVFRPFIVDETSVICLSICGAILKDTLLMDGDWKFFWIFLCQNFNGGQKYSPN